ncbi:MAG: VOC family protein [Ramlibacter sp.]|nr:VOC family protein [Ramlibacter sp.]
MVSTVDHLVIAAQSLAQGVAWCEAELGVTPQAGGEHPLMGTHNRVLRISTSQFARAYLEIIAIDPDARDPGRTRWFDLDDPALREAIRQQPRLVHFVVRCEPAAAGLRALVPLGIERGPLLAARRDTPFGLLQWKISVRDDGQRLFYGALPTLIEWGELHPANFLPESGLELLAVAASHPRPDALRAAYEAIGLEGVTLQAGPPNLSATLRTPRGEVILESKGV